VRKMTGPERSGPIGGTYGSKLYVGGLTSPQPQTSCAPTSRSAGPSCPAAVVTERDTAQSRGFGFVEMSSGRRAGDFATLTVSGLPSRSAVSLGDGASASASEDISTNPKPRDCAYRARSTTAADTTVPHWREVGAQLV